MAILQVHFTAEDLARTRVSSRPDPMWEIVGSLHRLQTRRGHIEYEGWLRRMRRDVAHHGLAGPLRDTLLPLVRLATFFPDFLTPAGSADVDADEAIETVCGTDRRRIRREVALMESAAGAAPFLDDLAAGRLPALRELGTAMRRYFDAAIRPYWPAISATVSGDRALRGARALDGGIGRLLEDLGSRARWEPPVLYLYGYPVERRVVLGGAGLTLIPSYFCWRDPIMLADPTLPQVLVYPAARRPHDVPGARRLGPLIGRTRVAVLHATRHGATTGEIARRAEISPATASQHATVLRESGLVTSERHANLVIHRITALGRALLDNAETPTPR